jgi:hypothetical protein
MRKTFVIGALLLGSFASAGTKDVSPYKFAEMPTENGLYKMVYQDCEIFVAVGDNGFGGMGQITRSQVHPIAIALGRGCK